MDPEPTSVPNQDHKSKKTDFKSAKAPNNNKERDKTLEGTGRPISAKKKKKKKVEPKTKAESSRVDAPPDEASKLKTKKTKTEWKKAETPKDATSEPKPKKTKARTTSFTSGVSSTPKESTTKGKKKTRSSSLVALPSEINMTSLEIKEKTPKIFSEPLGTYKTVAIMANKKKLKDLAMEITTYIGKQSLMVICYNDGKIESPKWKTMFDKSEGELEQNFLTGVDRLVRLHLQGNAKAYFDYFPVFVESLDDKEETPRKEIKAQCIKFNTEATKLISSVSEATVLTTDISGTEVTELVQKTTHEFNMKLKYGPRWLTDDEKLDVEKEIQARKTFGEQNIQIKNHMEKEKSVKKFLYESGSAELCKPIVRQLSNFFAGQLRDYITDAKKGIVMEYIKKQMTKKTLSQLGTQHVTPGLAFVACIKEITKPKCVIDPDTFVWRFSLHFTDASYACEQLLHSTIFKALRDENNRYKALPLIEPLAISTYFFLQSFILRVTLKEREYQDEGDEELPPGSKKKKKKEKSEKYTRNIKEDMTFYEELIGVSQTFLEWGEKLILNDIVPKESDLAEFVDKFIFNFYVKAAGMKKTQFLNLVEDSPYSPIITKDLESFSKRCEQLPEAIFDGVGRTFFSKRDRDEDSD